MEPPEFTSKALTAMAAAALIAMACVLWLANTPALVETETTPLQASPDLPTFKPLR
jgi:hypothetical protein